MRLIGIRGLLSFTLIGSTSSLLGQQQPKPRFSDLSMRILDAASAVPAESAADGLLQFIEGPGLAQTQRLQLLNIVSEKIQVVDAPIQLYGLPIGFTDSDLGALAASQKFGLDKASLTIRLLNAFGADNVAIRESINRYSLPALPVLDCQSDGVYYFKSHYEILQKLSKAAFSQNEVANFKKLEILKRHTAKSGSFTELPFALDFISKGELTKREFEEMMIEVLISLDQISVNPLEFDVSFSLVSMPSRIDAFTQRARELEVNPKSILDALAKLYLRQLSSRYVCDSVTADKQIQELKAKHLLEINSILKNFDILPIIAPTNLKAIVVHRKIPISEGEYWRSVKYRKLFMTLKELKTRNLKAGWDTETEGLFFMIKNNLADWKSQDEPTHERFLNIKASFLKDLGRELPGELRKLTAFEIYLAHLAYQEALLGSSRFQWIACVKDLVSYQRELPSDLSQRVIGLMRESPSPTIRLYGQLEELRGAKPKR